MNAWKKILVSAVWGMGVVEKSTGVEHRALG